MRLILINEVEKEYLDHQIREVQYNTAAKRAKVYCSIITPEGAWNYYIEGFPYDEANIDTSSDEAYEQSVAAWTKEKIESVLFDFTIERKFVNTEPSTENNLPHLKKLEPLSQKVVEDKKKKKLTFKSILKCLLMKFQKK